jgi:hypothetical protein
MEKKLIMKVLDEQMENIIEYKPDKCPDCGKGVKYYHGNGGSRIVCIEKCKGYKIIASTKLRDRFFQKGDVT